MHHIDFLPDRYLIEQKIMTPIIIKIFEYGLLQFISKNSAKHMSSARNPNINQKFPKIRATKMQRIWSFSDFIGSKMVKIGLKIFSAWILKGVAYTNLRKMHTG